MSDHPLQRARILVTGGAGFIGSNLVRRLSEVEARVRVLDDFSTGLHRNVEGVPHVEVIEGDVRDHDAVARAVKGCDSVVHLAAIGSVPRSLDVPVSTHAVNALGTVAVIEAARAAKVRRVVHASSCAVYGDDASEIKREDRIGAPLSPYAASKAAAEIMALGHARTFGQDVLGLRFFNVYGANQRPDSPYAAVIPIFIHALATGRRPVIHGDGLQVRDFIHVEDVVDAILLALESAAPFHGESINVATGASTSVMDLFRLLRDLLAADVEPVMEPARPGDVRESRADVTLARQRLGFEAARDLAQGLRATVDWYRERSGRP